MALLGMYAMQNSAFCFIVRQPNRQIGIQTLTSNTPQIFNVTNTNSLLNTAGVDGIKTAKASMSGPCLLLSVTRNAYVVSNGSVPQRLIIVVLGTSQRYKIARSLITPSWRLWERWYKAGANTTNPKEFLTFPAKVTPQTASSFGNL